MRSGCCAGHFLVMGKAEKSVIKNSLEMRNKPSAVIESGWAIGKSRPNPFNISAAAGHCLWRAGQVRTLLMARALWHTLSGRGTAYNYSHDSILTRISNECAYSRDRK